LASAGWQTERPTERGDALSLTLPNGPLSREPSATNYEIEGPENRMLFQGFPRRVRALLAETTVLDTRDGKLLHETGYLPQLYVPREDVRVELLEATDHTTNCPFKGDASYWSVRVGDRLAENALWGYEEPLEPVSWLQEHMALYWDRMDAWLDEDERVEGHLCDPYHRVDARRSSRHVRVTADGELLAETRQPIVLSETGRPNRFYVPRGDVVEARLEPSHTHSVCPYKGRASHWSARVGGRRLEDVALAYDAGPADALEIAGHVCFLGPHVQVRVDGEDVA
jgi:uncharacterized protein (DUF427 family)